jgi:hypothetical protein
MVTLKMFALHGCAMLDFIELQSALFILALSAHLIHIPQEMMIDGLINMGI